MADRVDQILAQWARERPDLDTSPMGLIGRVYRLGDELNEQLRPTFAQAALAPGDFDVLATLRRSGSPYALTPGEIATSSMVTSGAVTKRVDRLEARGLVRRSVCAEDARSRRVWLTDAGLELVDELVEQHVANESRLVAGLSEIERTRLAHLLRRWAVSLGDVPDPGQSGM